MIFSFLELSFSVDQGQQIEIHAQHGHPELKQAEAPHDCQHGHGAADVTALQEIEHEIQNAYSGERLHPIVTPNSFPIFLGAPGKTNKANSADFILFWAADRQGRAALPHIGTHEWLPRIAF
jgi:hypothetical protein